MISFAAFRPAPEVRESEANNEVVQAAVAAASTGTAASDKLGTIEACVGLWERAFASAEAAALEPWLLALCGRQLLLRGEFVAWRSGRSGLLPAASYDVEGESAAPSRWRYVMNLPAPSGAIVRRASADRVMHVRIGATREQPWRGCSPLVNAGATSAALKQIERSLTEEHGGPVGHVFGVPNPEDSQSVADEIGVLKGRSILAEATELDLPGEGRGGRTSWEPHRVGPEPVAATLTAREQTERSLMAAAGVPAELVSSSSAGEGREAWRRFLWATIAPVAQLVAAELRRLGLESEIAFDRLNASDLAGRARAFGQLVSNGVLEADARRLTGLE
ncbi:MAG: hypothetical protein OXG44_06240 [Gammaproteobacteria bacterium]|nr:hypothetical protein [Gammaproteobacteria bacterium]